MTLSEISHIAMEMGVLLLASGAETYRVEESIQLVCFSLGVKEAEIFVIPSTIIIYIRKRGGETCTRTRRVHKRSIDLAIVDQINNLSRRLNSGETFTYEELIHEIDLIRRTPEYPFFLQVLGTAFVAQLFTLFLGGSFLNSCIGFIIGIIIKLQTHSMKKFQTNQFFIDVIAGSIVSLLAIFAYSIGLSDDFNTVIIGSIMPLVPGLAITNSLRDVIAGDYLSGITKGIEAFLIGTAIATGVALPLGFFNSVLGG